MDKKKIVGKNGIVIEWLLVLFELELYCVKKDELK